MINTLLPPLQDELERHVSAATGRRVRNLSVEVGPERVILRGLAASYYVKQLAQHGIRDLLPNLVLENTIVVDRNLGLEMPWVLN